MTLQNYKIGDSNITTMKDQNNFLTVPVAVPIPINEEPALAIIALTSAKSTFTNPGICKNSKWI